MEMQSILFLSENKGNLVLSFSLFSERNKIDCISIHNISSFLCILSLLSICGASTGDTLSSVEGIPVICRGDTLTTVDLPFVISLDDNSFINCLLNDVFLSSL